MCDVIPKWHVGVAAKEVGRCDKHVAMLQLALDMMRLEWQTDDVADQQFLIRVVRSRRAV